MCARGRGGPGFGRGDWAPFDSAVFGEWMSGAGWRGAGRGRRGPGRVFDRGDLKFAILRLLERKPMHGYEVMQALEEEACGWYSASPGSVYPSLQMLQDQGHVTSEERDGKRVFSITDAGRAFLHENRDRVEDVADRLSDIADRFTGAPMRDLTRSFMRFAQVSWEEAMRHAGDDAALSRLREIIEKATGEMRTDRTSGATS
jgi:DNA-binding PadR family transcriptional regulator